MFVTHPKGYTLTSRSIIIAENIVSAAPATVVAAGSVAGGSVAGGSVAGGSVAGGSVAGGSVAGGSVAGGSVSGGTVGGSVGGMTGMAAIKSLVDPATLLQLDEEQPVVAALTLT